MKFQWLNYISGGNSRTIFHQEIYCIYCHLLTSLELLVVHCIWQSNGLQKNDRTKRTNWPKRKYCFSSPFCWMTEDSSTDVVTPLFVLSTSSNFVRLLLFFCAAKYASNQMKNGNTNVSTFCFSWNSAASISTLPPKNIANFNLNALANSHVYRCHSAAHCGVGWQNRYIIFFFPFRQKEIGLWYRKKRYILFLDSDKAHPIHFPSQLSERRMVDFLAMHFNGLQHAVNENIKILSRKSTDTGALCSVTLSHSAELKFPFYIQ